MPLPDAQQYVRLAYTYYVEDDTRNSNILQFNGDPENILCGGQPFGPCRKGMVGSNFCGEVISDKVTGGTSATACDGFNTSAPLTPGAADSTFGPAVGATPAFQLDVEPTALAQAKYMINKIIYQPPGNQSFQQYTTNAARASKPT